jgi:aspartyl-tRNA(Asn)/glutamyl-tRNA(Gln) amidotransferase subunit C
MLAFAMPSALTRERVAAIAALAHLELDEPELDLFARQLANILDYANQVQAIDTTGVPPTASLVAGHTADRADQVQPSLDIVDTLANAPDADRSRLEGGFFKVPRVIG